MFFNNWIFFFDKNVDKMFSETLLIVMRLTSHQGHNLCKISIFLSIIINKIIYVYFSLCLHFPFYE